MSTSAFVQVVCGVHTQRVLAAFFAAGRHSRLPPSIYLPISNIAIYTLSKILEMEKWQGDHLGLVSAWVQYNDTKVYDKSLHGWLDHYTRTLVREGRTDMIRFLLAHVMKYTTRAYPNALTWTFDVRSEEMADVFAEHMHGVLRFNLYGEMLIGFCSKFRSEKYGNMFMDFTEQNPLVLLRIGANSNPAACRALFSVNNPSKEYLTRVIRMYDSHATEAVFGSSIAPQQSINRWVLEAMLEHAAA